MMLLHNYETTVMQFIFPFFVLQQCDDDVTQFFYILIEWN